MRPENYRYGGGVAESLLHPAAAVVLLVALVCVVGLPRKYASLPVLWVALLLPVGQQFYVAGVHVFVLRLVILVGLVRAVASWKRYGGGVNGIDRAFLVCTLAQAVCPILLFGQTQTLVFEVGYVCDWLGAYYVFRWLIQNEEDVCRLMKFIAVLMLPVALGMLVEHVRMFNVFSVFGGVPTAPEVREGKVRAQGVFSHSLMAGCFAAVLMPLFLMLWKTRKSRGLGALGAVVATVMMYTSNSSTPLLAYTAGIMALFVWPLRMRMRKIRWAIASALIALHLVMKAPVWFLIARIDLTGSSSSYHRAALVDQFIKHFGDWWLIGTDSALDWGLDMWDQQNQYVNVGNGGGLLALLCFILVISRSFGRIGHAVKLTQGDARRQWLLWSLGCSLFANIVGFFGVNYFDQSRIGWIALLAMISACTAPVCRAKAGAETKIDLVQLDLGGSSDALVCKV